MSAIELSAMQNRFGHFMFPALDKLYYRIVDAFEPGKPAVLFWLAWDEDADFLACTYETHARQLLDKVTPTDYSKSVLIWRSVKPLPYPWLFGFTDSYWRVNHIVALDTWLNSHPRHHDLFVCY